MKSCPFCAESIQDAAIVCKHCNRELPVSQASAASARPPAPLPAAPPTKASWTYHRNLMGLLVLVVLLGVFRAAVRSPAGLPGVIGGVVPMLPRITTVGDESALTIPAGGVQTWKWQVDAMRPRCLVTGRILGISGGERDVDVLVMNEDDYINWSNRHAAHTLFQSGKKTAITLGVPVVGVGYYRLAVSNAFSVFTPKVIQTQGVKITCS